MSASIHFGFFLSNAVSTSGSINLGVNVVQNRNSSKQNIGNLQTFEGNSWMATKKLINFDSDIVDNYSVDANNYAGA
ncbi:MULTISPECIES: hypothetical protein [unclassified Thermoactinomyces]|jgi:hypothetical protein|uniref:hypothetical protein n=1 Tax=unclassified Thermoactinomyces TaxID=2634588 RepID=UPI0018DE0BE3|nr:MULTISPECIES: hypothetical protein [unclassified Thermoactinomyces]MBH8597034.1 hypothetical protein [Thermoactinomyces sp. CICC 10523]MBH8603811.1 hypothetical protein [Thermoactinomyces sp. CICC 10522]MBH8608867.1 hypothetical protein [Thermoactinomyces sp. CICC 10521]